MTTTRQLSPTDQKSFDDYDLTSLEQVPPLGDCLTPAERRLVEIAAPAVGQLVVETPRGDLKVNKRGPLRTPAIKLRHKEFLGGLPLYQDVHLTNTEGEKVPWDLNAYFDEHVITSFATACVFERRDWIITAYHAIDPRAISEDRDAPRQTYFMFGRNHRSEHAAPRGRKLKVPRNSYRRCRRIVPGMFGNDGAESGNDWVIIELDREVPGHVLPIQRFSSAAAETPKPKLFVLQHPLGLPLKFSMAEFSTKKKKDKDTTPKIYTDIGTGSSGSPLLSFSDCAAQLVGVIGGGKVAFDETQLRQLGSGVVIDPGKSGRRGPHVAHAMTPIDNLPIELLVDPTPNQNQNQNQSGAEPKEGQ